MTRHPNRPIDQRIAKAIIEEATERAVRGGPHECLLWPDRIDGSGYGVTGWGGARAHRLAYAAAYEDPGPLLVRHLKCDNPPCFDYLHLAVGTDADNMADKVAAGRSRPRRTMTEQAVAEAARLVNGGMTTADAAALLGVPQSTLSRSASHLFDPHVTVGRHERKVSDEDVLAARLDYTNGRATLQQIAKRLNVSWPSAQNLVLGRTYAHVGNAHLGPPVVIPKTLKVCSAKGCTRPAVANDLCHPHYDRVRLSGDAHADKPLRKRLNEDLVREIRLLRREGYSQREIAERIGMSTGTVENVVAGRTWAHVDG